MASEQQHTSVAPMHYSQWFVLVTAVFITCLITANITAVKLVGVFGLVLPAAVISTHRWNRCWHRCFWTEYQALARQQPAGSARGASLARRSGRVWPCPSDLTTWLDRNPRLGYSIN